MAKGDRDQNGHHFNFDTAKCFHCGKTFSQLDDAGMPQCQGTPSSSDDTQPLADNPRWGVRDG